MGKYKNALFLIICMPFIICKMARKYQKECIVTVVAIFLLVLLWINKGKDLRIIDVTPAFNTGVTSLKPKVCVVLHHTAGNPNGTISDICKVHFGEHRWSGIGYHYFIAANGDIFQLRSENEVVPHAIGFNDNAVAVCFAGNFELTEPTEEQWESALLLVRDVLKRHNLTTDNIYKHNELKGNHTKCCGVLFDIEKFKKDL